MYSQNAMKILFLKTFFNKKKRKKISKKCSFDKMT